MSTSDVRSHRAAPRRRTAPRGLRAALASRRVRALLGLGVAGTLGATTTFAFWTDDVVISGTSVTAAVLDLQVNNGDSYATTTLAMSAMVPGNTSAEVLTLRNNGTAPLKWTLAGGLGGTDAASYATASALKLTITAGGTRSGSGNSATCTAGTGTLVNAVALTAVTGTSLISTRQGPVAASGTATVCVQITFDAAAPTSLQGKGATVVLTATGTSDVS